MKAAQLDICPICQDQYRDAVDQLLYLGYENARIVEELRLEVPEGAQPTFWLDAIRLHLFNKHVQPFSRQNYTVAMVRYLQEAKEIEVIERAKPEERQREKVLERCDRARRWAIDAMAKFEGYYQANSKHIGADSQRLLEALAAENPQLAERTAIAARRKEPVAIEARTIEPGQSTESDAGETS